jgi:hypothetical protein
VSGVKAIGSTSTRRNAFDHRGSATAAVDELVLMLGITPSDETLGLA